MIVWRIGKLVEQLGNRPLALLLFLLLMAAWIITLGYLGVIDLA